MCEYCENTFSNKVNKNIMKGELRSIREIYDTLGWKPEGWSVDGINEELKLPEIENDETIKIDFDILDPKNPWEENSKEENEKLKKLVNSAFGVPEEED